MKENEKKMYKSHFINYYKCGRYNINKINYSSLSVQLYMDLCIIIFEEKKEERKKEHNMNNNRSPLKNKITYFQVHTYFILNA